MQIERAKLEKLLSASYESMFRVYANLGIPDDIIKAIFYDKDIKGLNRVADWAKQANVQDRQKTLIMDLINLGISVAGIGNECGFILQLKEELTSDSADSPHNN